MFKINKNKNNKSQYNFDNKSNLFFNNKISNFLVNIQMQ